MVSYTFKKAERLCSKILIDNLFAKGNRVVTQFPFRVLWQFNTLADAEYPAMVMISVSKRNFPKAVDRNRIKRQLRELYRLNKHTLYEALSSAQVKITLSLAYQAGGAAKAGDLPAAFDKLLVKLIRQVRETGTQHEKNP
jgi:ribonuclease P protein component